MVLGFDEAHQLNRINTICCLISQKIDNNRNNINYSGILNYILHHVEALHEKGVKFSSTFSRHMHSVPAIDNSSTQKKTTKLKVKKVSFVFSVGLYIIVIKSAPEICSQLQLGGTQIGGGLGVLGPLGILSPLLSLSSYIQSSFQQKFCQIILFRMPL